MKQYVGLSRDHSASMKTLAGTAMKDYNEQIEGIKKGAYEHNIDTIVSVVECGVNEEHRGLAYSWGQPRRATNRFVVTNSSVLGLNKLTSYAADGFGTPLFDSIGELIEQLEKNPDAKNDDVSFLIMAITDGQENQSVKYTAEILGKKIQQLQGTDRWTFALRVPYGFKRALVAMGIPAGNIQEWEQTERGFRESTAYNVGSTVSYMDMRAQGMRSTSNFYADVDTIKMKDVQNKLTPIKGYTIWQVDKPNQIKKFIEEQLGKTMMVGGAFYQLTKPEKVQGYKAICIREKNSGKVYTGDAARGLLKIPTGGEIKLHPGNVGNFDVFIQSTSVNRNLIPGTEVLYWPGA